MSTVHGLEGRRPGVGSSAAAGDGAATPPSTNRGCFKPVMPSGDVKTQIESDGLDYLKVTVFAPLDDVRSRVEDELERVGGNLFWEQKGPARHWEHILFLGTTGDVVLYGPKTFRDPYCMIEVKGTGCSLLDAGGALEAFLRAVYGWGWRVNAKRVDYRWDGHGLSPYLLEHHRQLGNFTSRAFGPSEHDLQANAEGSTFYLGNPKKSPRTRLLRCYDRRGYNRLEGEWHEPWADDMCRELLVVPRAGWSQVAMGYARGMVDFVDAARATRVSRAPLLPWWEAFVGEAMKVTRRVHSLDAQRLETLPIGQADAWVQRNARALVRLFDALGSAWVESRARHWAAGKLTDQDREEIARLSTYRSSGLAGTAPDDCPI